LIRIVLHSGVPVVMWFAPESNSYRDRIMINPRTT